MVSRAVKLLLLPFVIFALLAIPIMALAQGADATAPLSAGDLAEVVAQVGAGFGAYGWLGALAALLAVSIRLARMIPGFPWDKLPRWAQVLIVFALAFASAGLLAFLGGGGAAAVIAGGLTAGLAALGMHQTMKAVAPGVASPSNPPGLIR